MKRGQIGERQARQLIQAEWAEWPGKSGAASDRPAFYDWLVENRPQLLHFHLAGDKRKIIISWLGGA